MRIRALASALVITQPSQILFATKIKTKKTSGFTDTTLFSQFSDHPHSDVVDHTRKGIVYAGSSRINGTQFVMQLVINYLSYRIVMLVLKYTAEIAVSRLIKIFV